MIDSVEAYLERLALALTAHDTATRQDALADAEEHLRTALEQSPEYMTGGSEADALPPIVEKYGTPEEIAAAYQEIESMTSPALAEFNTTSGKSMIGRFFAVIADARAWGALLYLILSMLIGIVYFAWAVVGVSLSLSLMILIIGLPFTVLFLLSVQTIAFVEGRIVEGLLGVRMPPRPLFSNRQGGWREQVKSLFQEPRTWTALFYMILRLPLGIIYFTLFITMIAIGLILLASPVMVLGFGLPLLNIDGQGYYPPTVLLPVLSLSGLLLLLTIMHLGKLAGQLHGALAKAMLVGSHPTAR